MNKLAVFTASIRIPRLRPHDSEIALAHLREWCEVTAWHCINNVQRAAAGWRRGAWLLVVLLSAALAIYQSCVLVLEFAHDDKWVTSIGHEMPEDMALDWPNISVCHTNEFFKSGIKRAGLRDPHDVAYLSTQQADGIEFFDRYQADNPANESDLLTITERVKNFHMQRMQKYLTVREIIDRYTRKCNDTVLHCGLSETFDLSEKNYSCCDSYGKLRSRSCFSMHPSNTFGKSFKSPGRFAGNDYAGVYYLLNPNVSDYYEYLTLDSKPLAGLSFQLYFGSFEETVPEALMLAPGIYGLVSLVPVKHLTVPQRYPMFPTTNPKEVCRPNTYTYIDSETNSHQLCRLDCFIGWEIHQCGCTTETVKMKEFHDCAGENITICGVQSRSVEKLNYTFEDGFNYATCKQKCRDSCEYKTVTARIAQAQFPAPPKVKAFTTYLNRALPEFGPFTEEDAKQLIMFEMFYETLEYQVVTKTEKSTIGQVISNVGGALGVWTGLSLLSIFQAVVYLSTCVSKIVANEWRRRTNRETGVPEGCKA